MSWIEDPGFEMFRGLNLSQLQVDQAYVNVTSEVPQLFLYSLSDECYKCPFTRDGPVDVINNALTVATQYSFRWRLLRDGSSQTISVDNLSSVVCEVEANLGEFGVYDLWIRENEGNDSQIACELITSLEPVNIYLPLVICLLGLLVIWIFFTGIPIATRRWIKHKHTISPIGHELDSVPPAEDKSAATQQPAQRQRLKSLDTFRGISIVLMIFVNHGAGHYAVLEHATWNGLQIADVLFPWFMWIMGVCIPISITSQLKKNVPRFEMLIGVFRRACILFLLGLILNTLGRGSHLESIRLFGVLQRFGVVYFVITVIFIFFTCRDCITPKGRTLAVVQDIVLLLPQWIIMLGFLAVHCAITFILPVPGCPVGYLGPGGRQDGGIYKDCIGGATGYVDRLVLGVDHIYQNPTAGEVYNAGPFDPEGLVGCLTSVFQVFLGVQAGTVLVLHKEWKGRLIRWLIWGTLCGLVGTILCLASKEDGWIPVNKNLWSISFVLVTSCFAFFLLTACYFLIDVKHWWSGSPFFYPGMNATIMYVGHSVCYNLFPWHWTIGLMNTHFMNLLENIWGTLLWIAVGIWLHHIKFFLSL